MFLYLLGKKRVLVRKQYVQYDPILLKYMCVFIYLYVKNSRNTQSSICQDISDYFWVVDFESGFILFLLLLVFSGFLVMNINS
jgi:hypothetical protein